MVLDTLIIMILTDCHITQAGNVGGCDSSQGSYTHEAFNGTNLQKTVWL